MLKTQMRDQLFCMYPHALYFFFLREKTGSNSSMKIFEVKNHITKKEVDRNLPLFLKSNIL